jgi:hypothetical protein
MPLILEIMLNGGIIAVAIGIVIAVIQEHTRRGGLRFFVKSISTSGLVEIPTELRGYVLTIRNSRSTTIKDMLVYIDVNNDDAPNSQPGEIYDCLVATDESYACSFFPHYAILRFPQLHPDDVVRVSLVWIHGQANWPISNTSKFRISYEFGTSHKRMLHYRRVWPETRRYIDKYKVSDKMDLDMQGNMGFMERNTIKLKYTNEYLLRR